MNTTMRWTFAVALAAIAAGCAGDVPSPTLVEDLRVLAIRAEPPEVLVDGPGAPLGSVTFDALVVDPRGLATSYTWSFCPVASAETCGDYDRKRAAAPEAAQPALDLARALQAQGDAGPPPDGGVGDQAIGSFAVPLPEELFAYHLADSALGLGNGAWLSAVLALRTGEQVLTAQKRVVLNARDLSVWNPQLQAAFGWQVCAAGSTEPGCLPLAPRTPNHNPDIATVELARGAHADVPFAPVDGPISVAPGETVRLRPVLADGAIESYQTIESALQGSTLHVVDRSEEPIVSWFTTAGKVADEHTAAQLTKTLDTAYTAPDAPPQATGGRVSVWMVVRDQRGGVGWTRVDLVVTP
jgi:hypothetical protein